MKFEINGEFGYEMVLAAPLVYNAYLKEGKVDVENVKDTKCFYFFSNEHVETSVNRGIFIEVKQDGKEIIRRHHHSAELYHTPKLDTTNWTPPPYSAYYKNDAFVFDKPLFVISNKYNNEWNGGPVNYLSLDTLDQLFSYLSKDYQIVYNRPLSKDIVNDNSEIKNLGDFELIKSKYKEVLLLDDIIETKGSAFGMSVSYNTAQMMLYANCSKFISTQGGNGILCSYFGGINIIFAKHGGELKSGAYDNWFKYLSSCEIQHTDNKDALIKMVKYLA